jgi:hypothetical protein
MILQPAPGRKPRAGWFKPVGLVKRKETNVL